MKQQVCVIGLGHVGLPMACMVADASYKVHGVDINKNVIDQIQTEDLKIHEPELQDILRKVLKNGSLSVSAHIKPASIYILAVPTLLTESNTADLSYLNSAVDSMKPYLQPETLIIIESTCPVGTTDKIAKDLSGSCPNLKVAYCPERVMPGHVVHEFIHNDRIVGGIDEISTQNAISFYKSFVKGEVKGTAARIAEAVKLAENAYRDVNIAFANELSMLAWQMGFDINELINLANKHPRVNILRPGVGVGGHCIAIDPWYFISASPNLTSLMFNARHVNLKKTKWVIQQIRNEIKINNCRMIACLGVTYKPNSYDIRNSPAKEVVEDLKKDFEVLVVDPYVKGTTFLTDFLKQADMVIGLVAHNEFLKINPYDLKEKVVLDFCGIFERYGRV